MVGAWHVVQRSHKSFHRVNALLNLCIWSAYYLNRGHIYVQQVRSDETRKCQKGVTCIMMLSVDIHDRVGDSLDFLSMLSNGLVAMLGGYAMCVDGPREILEGVNILLDFRIDMLPFNIINRTIHLFQLIHILDDLRKFMMALNPINWANHLFHGLCSLHDLGIVVISFYVHERIVQILDGLNLSRVRSESMLVVLLCVVNRPSQVLQTLHLLAELIELVLVVNIHDWVVQSLQGVNRLLDFHKLAAVVTLIDWPSKILDFIHLFGNFIEGAFVVAGHDRTKLRLGHLGQVLLNLAVAVLELLQLINRASQIVQLLCMLHDHIILVPLIHIHRP